MGHSFRNAKPFTWRPRGLSDTEDATDAFPGAMQQLVNLVPSPTTPSAWVPRPAGAELAAIGQTGTALLIVGDIAYGFVGMTTGPYAGYDVPFAYDLATLAALPISGISVANLPTSQPTAGNWTPPTVTLIGGRVIFTHPGFLGASNGFFGWLDISGFSDNTKSGVVAVGSQEIGIGPNVGQDGWAVGMTISGPDLPPNTTITDIEVSDTDLNTTGTTNGTTTISSIASLAGVVLGATVTAADALPGTYVVAIGSGTVTLNQATTGAGSAGEAINFSGGTTVTVSAAATGSSTAEPLTVTGGSASAPQWASGNTSGMPLAGIPVAAANFNDRAWYAVGDAVVFSDTGNPTNVGNLSVVQVITFDNGLDVTALDGLPLNSTSLGGMVQSLICFQGDSNIAQITGDAATGNLARNNIGVGVGTLAPNTVAQTPLGLMFVATDGLRVIDFLARVSDPIGASGDGIANPFINAIWPSRMAAAFNQNVYRVSVQNGAAPGQPVQDYWFHLNPREKVWSGPHTLPCRVLSAWQGPQNQQANHGFIGFPYVAPGQLWDLPVVPLSVSNYIENGATLQCAWETALLPDSGGMTMNAVPDSALMVKSPNNVGIAAYDENGNLIDAVTLPGIPGGALAQQQIPWTERLVFKQASVLATFAAAQNVEIGNLYLRYQQLGYLVGNQSATPVIAFIELESAAGDIGLEDGSGAILLEIAT